MAFTALILFLSLPGPSGHVVFFCQQGGPLGGLLGGLVSSASILRFGTVSRGMQQGDPLGLLLFVGHGLAAGVAEGSLCPVELCVSSLDDAVLATPMQSPLPLGSSNGPVRNLNLPSGLAFGMSGWPLGFPAHV